MPIDYKRYPPNWKSEIVPRILKRSNNQCENDNCNFKNGQLVWSVRFRGKTIGWFETFEEADKQEKSFESKFCFRTKQTIYIPNPKQVKVVLTIAHLDHDETNFNVTDDRLKAMCQLCHLRYDAKEKYKRSKQKKL